MKREVRDRDTEAFTPQKASPYHNPQHAHDVAKIGITKDLVDNEEYFAKYNIPYDQPEATEKPSPSPEPKKEENEPIQEAGRPMFSKDTMKRKQKRVLPKSSDTTVAMLWAMDAQAKISEVLSPIALAHFDKKNVRSLTKSEVDQLEHLKLCILTGLKPFMDIDETVIKNLLQAQINPPQEFTSFASEKVEQFVDTNNRQPNSNEMKMIYSTVFAELSHF